jgi:hypothetical protein
MGTRISCITNYKFIIIVLKLKFNSDKYNFIMNTLQFNKIYIKTRAIIN